ncbi:MAG: hypothetical protein LQ343_007266 [Gyalolechia ehrenbergii]|nr:MAG: hypothetical protein LQ343_007266 [Gyalolechia ehrenbergii]
MEDCPAGAWGWAVLGILPDELCNVLDQFQQRMAAGSTVSLQDEKSLHQSQLPDLGRIAIVGMAGRGPGSDNLEDFWDLIMSKKDLCEEIPKDRFEIEDFYCPEHGGKCTTTTRFGCFMNKPGNFDSRFFHV